ncbi:OpgC domain-containing protein [uncultured Paracoccus sp.]|uniref:OpgC domain-containing protein n=1 Tax=uncultured Paracoccus sp. TaxID=189685 RepID=UPI0026188805|nr:OpgC domain-containing protein [uncultured Paracoccus sp.]
MNRILALDMLRGYALISIMLNHMPAGVLREVTLANFAIFDAAELFVLLSGFLVGLVWRKVQAIEGMRAAQRRFARRTVQVWLALVIGGVLVALLSRLLFGMGLHHTAVWSEYAAWITRDPLGYVGAIALMWLQPNLVDVLALYVLLLAAAPLAVPALLRWPVPFAAASAGVWLLGGPLNDLLPNHRSDGGMLFNPFGWQMLFFAGVAIGLFRQAILAWLSRWSRLVTMIATAVALYSAGMVLLWRFGPDAKRIADLMWHAVGQVDKWSLDGMRFVAVLAWAWLVSVPLSGPLGRLAAIAPGRAMATIGRGGLVSFVACVLLSLLGDALATNPAGSSVPRRLAVDLWTIGALWLVAELWLNRALYLGRRQPRLHPAE